MNPDVFLKKLNNYLMTKEDSETLSLIADNWGKLELSHKDWSNFAGNALLNSKFNILYALEELDVKLPSEVVGDVLFSHELRYKIAFHSSETPKLMVRMLKTPISHKVFKGLLEAKMFKEASLFFNEKNVDAWGSARFVKTIEGGILNLSVHGGNQNAEELLVSVLKVLGDLGLKDVLPKVLERRNNELRFHHPSYASFRNFIPVIPKLSAVKNKANLAGLDDLFGDFPYNKDSLLMKVWKDYCFLSKNFSRSKFFNAIEKMGLSNENLMLLVVDSQHIPTMKEFFDSNKNIDFRKSHKTAFERQESELTVPMMLLKIYGKYSILNKIESNSSKPKPQRALILHNCSGEFEQMFKKFFVNEASFGSSILNEKDKNTQALWEEFTNIPEVLEFVKKIPVEIEISKGLEKNASISSRTPFNRF